MNIVYSGKEPNYTHSGEWLELSFEPDQYGDIVIAGNTEPAPPVGGEVFPVDKLTLLTPYVTVILVIATAATIIKNVSIRL